MILKFQVQLMLEQHDMMELVQGTKKIPVPITAGNNVVSNADIIKTWKRKDTSVRLLVAATMDESHQWLQVNSKTACEI